MLRQLIKIRSKKNNLTYPLRPICKTIRPIIFTTNLYCTSLNSSSPELFTPRMNSCWGKRTVTESVTKCRCPHNTSPKSTSPSYISVHMLTFIGYTSTTLNTATFSFLSLDDKITFNGFSRFLQNLQTSRTFPTCSWVNPSENFNGDG